MENMNGNKGAIAYEAQALNQLAREGWNGSPDILRQLAKLGEKLRQRYENACSYEWACTETYERNTDSAEKRILNLATSAGLRIYLQGDCRGATVYVCGPNGDMNSQNYSTRGVCCYFNK